LGLREGRYIERWATDLKSGAFISFPLLTGAVGDFTGVPVDGVAILSGRIMVVFIVAKRRRAEKVTT
jgi:hypothetical protein